MSLSVHTAQSFVYMAGTFLRSCLIQGDTCDTEHVAFLNSLMLGQIQKLILPLLVFSCALLEITIPHSGL